MALRPRMSSPPKPLLIGLALGYGLFLAVTPLPVRSTPNPG
jgi:hypothetical protein